GGGAPPTEGPTPRPAVPDRPAVAPVDDANVERAATVRLAGRADEVELVADANHNPGGVRDRALCDRPDDDRDDRDDDPVEDQRAEPLEERRTSSRDLLPF